jgi:hypothetical protein
MPDVGGGEFFVELASDFNKAVETINRKGISGVIPGRKALATD